MKKSICVVRDITADCYANPFTAVNDAVAARDFGYAVKDPGSQLSKSPECFALFKIGEYDDQSGQLTSQMPVLLINATAFIQEN